MQHDPESLSHNASTSPKLRALLACAATVHCVTMFGCNTTKGMGKDVENLGEGIQDVADDADD